MIFRYTIKLFKGVILCCLIFLVSQSLYSQTVKYNITPVDWQLYPRNSQDSGTVVFNGEVQTPGYDSLYVELYRNGLYQKRKSQRLIYTAGKAPFNLSLFVHAECSEYKFRIYVNTSLVKTIDFVTCGDVYLVMGQSNSVEALSAYTYSNEFCRTFGLHTPNYNGDSYNPADTLWAMSKASDDNIIGRSPNVGVWALQLQKNIKEICGIPTAFINGGKASGNIELQFRNNGNPQDLTTIYGKLLYRVSKAHVLNNITAILHYGGESDGDPGYVNYIGQFITLYNQWGEDYPNFKKLFYFQVRPGCSDDEELGQLREQQRELAPLFNNIELFSTIGIAQHYGCHYGPYGYTEMGNDIFRNVAKQFYNGMDTTGIMAPNVRKVFYKNSLHNQIRILFSGSTVRGWPNDSTYGDVTVLNHSMKDYIYLDGAYGNVSGGFVSGDTLIINLFNPSSATKITYLPSIRDHTEQQVYYGPFFRNSRGLGAFSFFEYPISIYADTYINTKLIIEGLYNGSNLNRRDTIYSYLQRGTLIVDSCKSVLDSNTFLCNFVFRNAAPGNYYLKIKHRNSIATWSQSITINPGSTYNYDFTDNANKAFGNNLKLIGSKYCIYSGDVDQEGTVDLDDMIEVFNASRIYTEGYVAADVNGDNIVDVNDLILVFNNSAIFVAIISP